MDGTEFGQRIRQARQKAGLTQKELAGRIHVTDKAVSKWERAMCFPDLCNLEPLAETLGLTLPQLLGQEAGIPVQEQVKESVHKALEIAEEKRKQKKRDVVKVTVALTVLLGGSFLLLFFLFGHILLIKEKTEDIAKYTLYMEEPDKRNPFAPPGRNEWIFPRQIPKGALVNDFHYEYVDYWDASYVLYLDLTLEEEAYEKERERVEKCGIPFQEGRYMVNGASGFYDPLLSASGGGKGILYALTEEEKHRIMYVEIAYHDYFCDIAYDKIIPPEVLPIGFDARNGNPTQRAFHITNQKHLAEKENNGE